MLTPQQVVLFVFLMRYAIICMNIENGPVKFLEGQQPPLKFFAESKFPRLNWGMK